MNIYLTRDRQDFSLCAGGAGVPEGVETCDLSTCSSGLEPARTFCPHVLPHKLQTSASCLNFRRQLRALVTRSTQQKHGCHMETLLNNLKLGLATAATDCGEGEADCDGRVFYGDDNFDA